MQQHHHHHQQQQQQQHQMLYGGGGGGSGVAGGTGLSRFRSAPATWFDSLLEDDVAQQQQHPPSPQQQSPPTPTPTPTPPPPPPPPPPQIHQTQCLPQVPNLRNSNIFDPTTLFDTTFTRHNTSPPQLLASLSLPLSVGSEDFFSPSGVSSSYDILSCLDLPTTTERPSDSDSQQSSQTVKGEPGSGSYAEMEMDKLFQDSVPCRVRAKRGCATHPRSIAERVRRTRISDRIRKLQELVPNMDKQTNTADMLEEAVEYVKLLQKQIQELTERQKKCKCLARQL